MKGLMIESPLMLYDIRNKLETYLCSILKALEH